MGPGFRPGVDGLAGGGRDFTNRQGSHRRKLLVVAHTERGGNIRIISARRAGKRERVSYEENDYKSAGLEMRGEYDFSRGMRGKYARRYAQGANVVVLAPDVARVFPSTEAVNSSLRALAGIFRHQKKTLAAK